MKTPNQMTSEEIIQEIGDIRSSLESSGFRLMVLTKVLYSHTRKQVPDEGTSIHISYANSWMRFAGSLHQGIKRAANVDRVLVQYKKEASSKIEKEKKAAAKPIPPPKVESNSVFQDYAELYGEDFLKGGK